MYLSHLSIENLRSIGKAEFDFQFPGNPLRPDEDDFRANVNVFLGDNGTGKTTVLKAIALAILAPVISDSGFRPYFLVRRKAPERFASIRAVTELHFQDVVELSEFQHSTKQLRSGRGQLPLESALLRVKISRRGDYESISMDDSSLIGQAVDNMFQEDSPAFFVVAYGATRRVDDAASFVSPEFSRSRSVRYQRVAGLFENQIALVPLSTWLPELKERNKGRFVQVEHLLNRLLPAEAKFTGELIDREFGFNIHGQEVPFAALSDGYRAYISWISDLLYHITRTCPDGVKLTENKGVVMVDEVDLHLHPQWQKSILDLLSTTLPNLQFFFTTHSPIVASSIHKENIFVTSTDDDGESTVEQLNERIYGLSADQALESSYFGLSSTRPDSFLGEIKKLTEDSALADPTAALRLMERVSGVSKDELTADRTGERGAIRS